MFKIIVLLTISLWIAIRHVDGVVVYFPENFKFGVATSALQIEGTWFEETGKTENTWERYMREHPEIVHDNSNNDVSGDSYHHYIKDTRMLTDLGVNFYKFSLSWTRLLPTGHSNNINQMGVDYYDALINELLRNNITPVATLMHWETPGSFRDFGDWTNSIIVDYFVHYAEVAFEKFGDRVKEWVTFNEPQVLCALGYGRMSRLARFPPAVEMSGFGEYLCSHNVIKAHARVYHLYNEKFRAKQQGKISIGTYLLWSEPDTNSTEHQEMAERMMQFFVGWHAHPIYSAEGDYPKIMRDEIAKKSAEQGYKMSRLPKFTEDEVAYIRGTFDYIGLNYYTALVAREFNDTPNVNVPSFEDDFGFDMRQKTEWDRSISSWIKVHPEGFRHALNWMVEQYGNHEIRILENGFPSEEGLNDEQRIGHLKDYLYAVYKAIQDGCNVTAFTVWSLLDNFELFAGYMNRYGLYEVTFNDTDKRRTERASVKFYRELITTKKLDTDKNISYFDPNVIPQFY